MRSTSPAIQPRPGVTSYSRPRSAINCMPTQMPKNGRPLLAHALLRARRSCRGCASSPRRQSAKAPTPGSTTRSARATSSGSLVTTIGCVVPALARGALERLGRRMQIAGAVVDDGDAHRWAPGSGNRPITSAARRRPAPHRRGVLRRQALPAPHPAPVALVARLAHSAKKRRSAISAVLADHEAERLPAAPRQASSARCVAGLEADQQRDQPDCAKICAVVSSAPSSNRATPSAALTTR